MTTSVFADSIGRTLTTVRDRAGIPQAALAKRMGSNPTRVFRIENGEVVPSEEEVEKFLTALGTPLAEDCRQYLSAEWADSSRCPEFPHPNWRTLHLIDEQLVKIEQLKEDPDTKAVFVRALELYAADLVRCANFLMRINHHLVFVGIISVGKTSAICTSVGLTLSETLPFARRMVLEVGGGRITLCEVRVAMGPQYGLIVEPHTDPEVRRYVLDYADHLLMVVKHPERLERRDKSRDGGAVERKDKPKTRAKDKSRSEATEEIPWVSEEMARAIRGLSGLSENDLLLLAKEFPEREQLAIQILRKIDLLTRRETTVWCPASEPTSELEWMQRLFREINNGRRAGFSLPKRITVIVPRKLFDGGDLNIGVIDTKGIDQSSAREDIDAHLDDQHALIVLCTKFGEAPDLATMNLIRRAKGLHAEAAMDDRLVLLVLPRNEEALDMKDEATTDYVTSAEAGYEAKRPHIRRALHTLGAGDMPVKFMNATSAADVTAFRQFVVTHFEEMRKHYVDRVAETIRKLGELVAHRSAEERALAHAEVMEHLRVWTRDHETLDDTLRPDEVLVKEIGTTHPRTLWASVRREGDWSNFDYYYQLGYATRRLVASTAGEKVKEFKALIEHLGSHPDYLDAGEFLRQIAEHVDAAVDRLTREVQMVGQTIYRDRLHAASEYWKECEDVYGTGRPYRIVVADETRELFEQSTLADLHELLNEEISRGWSELIRGLNEILKEVPTSSSADTTTITAADAKE